MPTGPRSRSRATGLRGLASGTRGGRDRRANDTASPLSKDRTRARAGKEPRENYLGGATSCPICNTPPDQLTWSHVQIAKLTDPSAGIETEGWVTVCERCQIRVQNFARQFDDLLKAPYFNRSRQDGHDARARSVSAASFRVCTRSCASRGVGWRSTLRTKRRESALRAFPERRSTSAGHAARQTRLHKAPPTSGRSGARMSRWVANAFFGRFQLSCDSRVAPSAQREGPIEV